MSEVLGGLSTGNSVAVLVGLIGGLGLLIRGVLRYRSRVQAEREWSARTRARTMGLIRLVGGGSADVRIDERDRDGHRVVELRGLRRTDGGEAA